MKKLLLLGLFAFSINVFAIYNVGDTVPDMCWNDANAKSVCLNDYKDQVRVLLYNAGWCGPCQSEFREIGRTVSTYDGKAVTFLSLSSSGYSTRSYPDASFLNSWKNSYGLKFPVLAAPNDAGKDFFNGPYYIPAVVIIDTKGAVAYRAVNPGVSRIYSEVNNLLP